MRILKTRYFDRWAAHEGLTDNQLKVEIQEMEKGLHDGNIGNRIFKKRLGIRGKGKRGSLRTIIAYRFSEKAFFIYGYAKNTKDNITPKEKQVYKQLSEEYFKLDEMTLKKLIKSKELIEVVQ